MSFQLTNLSTVEQVLTIWLPDIADNRMPTVFEWLQDKPDHSNNQLLVFE